MGLLRHTSRENVGSDSEVWVSETFLGFSLPAPALISPASAHHTHFRHWLARTAA